MSATHTNLLRRTLAAVGAGLLIAASLPAASQGTVTLSGVTGNSCTYTQMIVQPNGSISVTCQSGVTPTPGVANFSVTVPSTTGAAGSSQVPTIRRTGGPADTALFVSWTYSGAGCAAGSFVNDGIFLVDGGQWQDHFTMAADGTCTITITPPANHTASPSSAYVMVGTAPPPPPPTGPASPAGCPAPEVGALARQLDFGYVDQLRMKSNVVAYYPVAANPDASRASIEFTQGQQPNTPGNAVTEFSVSICPGTIQTSVPDCYYRSSVGQVNNNKIVVFTKTKPEWGWTSQAAMAGFGCLADPSLAGGNPYYVNVKWTYPSCPYGDNCGFSMQWALGAW